MTNSTTNAASNDLCAACLANDARMAIDVEHTCKPVDLDELRPVSVAEVAKGPNRKWDENLKAPELFEHWWTKHGQKLLVGATRKEAARIAWYACAESLGVYDDK